MESDPRLKMEECFRELGVEYKYVEAVDGKDMTDDSVRRDGLRVLPGYVEPYSKRETLTFGEIGCFLSHHKVRRQPLQGFSNRGFVHLSFITSEAVSNRIMADQPILW